MGTVVYADGTLQNPVWVKDLAPDPLGNPDYVLRVR